MIHVCAIAHAIGLNSAGYIIGYIYMCVQSSVKARFSRCIVYARSAAAAFGSKNTYFYGSYGMRMKLIPYDSAGTVTTFYVSELGCYQPDVIVYRISKCGFSKRGTAKV